MTSYHQIERDFIERTKVILDQYEELVRPRVGEDNEYEVTLLMNCLLGLLVYPQQIASSDDHQKDFRNWLTNELVVDVGEEWGIAAENVISAGCKREGKDEQISIGLHQLTMRNLIRQMRNAAAHAKFYFYDDTHKIYQIEFRTTGYRCENEFHIVIPVSNLEKFVRKLATSALDHIPKG